MYEKDDISCVCLWNEAGECTEMQHAYNLANLIVAGGSVYMAGFSFDRKSPCYWKDGVRFDLPVPEGTNVVEIEHICVVEK